MNPKEELAILLEKDDYLILANHAKAIQKLYSFYFSEACSSCQNKQSFYLKRLKEMNLAETKKKMNKENKNFTLQKGFLLRFAGTSNSWSNENLTDQIALEFLKVNPNRILCFTHYPENWKELIKSPKERKPPTSPTPIKEKQIPQEKILQKNKPLQNLPK